VPSPADRANPSRDGGATTVVLPGAARAIGPSGWPARARGHHAGSASAASGDPRGCRRLHAPSGPRPRSIASGLDRSAVAKRVAAPICPSTSVSRRVYGPLHGLGGRVAGWAVRLLQFRHEERRAPRVGHVQLGNGDLPPPSPGPSPGWPTGVLPAALRTAGAWYSPEAALASTVVPRARCSAGGMGGSRGDSLRESGCSPRIRQPIAPSATDSVADGEYCYQLAA
jgi:hypothetical protein